MNRSKIEWTDYSINPVKGYCPMACEYCYARAMYRRFGWNRTIRFDPKPLRDLSTVKEPSRIFVGSTMELFGEWVKPKWWDAIWSAVEQFPQHTFIFLTKLPQELRRYNSWPDNCWVGVTTTGLATLNTASAGLCKVDAGTRFVSMEPLLGRMQLPRLPYLEMLFGEGWLDWLIVGGKSGRDRFYPPEEWIREIEDAADSKGIPVFEKDNLRKPMYSSPSCLPPRQWAKPPRREWPKEE